MEPDPLPPATSREALDLVALDYLAQIEASPALDVDGFFLALRRQIESRAQTLKLVRENGPLGGGGADEA